VDIRENLVLLEKKIRDHRNGAVLEVRFEQPPVAFVEEMHLRLESGAGLFVVELGEKGIFFAIEDAPRMHLFGEDAGESGFADANRPFYHDIPRRLEFGAAHRRAIIAKSCKTPETRRPRRVSTTQRRGGSLLQGDLARASGRRCSP